jgi:hypothetical protein
LIGAAMLYGAISLVLPGIERSHLSLRVCLAAIMLTLGGGFALTCGLFPTITSRW